MPAQRSIKELEELANKIREDIVKMLVTAGSGHSAGPLGMADVFSALYFEVLNVRPHEPRWPERDRFVLSCGHINPVFYATLANAGYFPKEELLTLRKINSRLQGHPHNLSLPGVEITSGPLGQGISQAVGMALAARLDGASWRVYAVMSDGEQDEGQTWEAVMFAGARGLDNLTAIIDRNNIQIDGTTSDVLDTEPLVEKYQSFGWHVLEIDGHNLQAIIDACRQAKAIHDKPTVIIAHTIPGKGVDFMENKFQWHGKPPNKEEAAKALHELRTLGGKIRSEHE